MPWLGPVGVWEEAWRQVLRLAVNLCRKWKGFAPSSQKHGCGPTLPSGTFSFPDSCLPSPAATAMLDFSLFSQLPLLFHPQTLSRRCVHPSTLSHSPAPTAVLDFSLFSQLQHVFGSQSLCR
ncbi:hypothetical protein BaRGS_00016127 [Batillaria attramentaria]|uniref:Uncharacterized protein n=1 Tax=Batillaria attramentaria TaxID=370345 RepID=A0ABD0L0A9_9CAEN